MPETSSVRYTCAGVHLNMGSSMCFSLVDLRLGGDGGGAVEALGLG